MTPKENSSSSTDVFAALMEIARRMREGTERVIKSLTDDQKGIAGDIMKGGIASLTPEQQEIARRMMEGGIASLTPEQQEIRQTLLDTSAPELGPVLAEELAGTLTGDEETTA